MKKLKLICGALLLFSALHISAGNPQKRWHEYKNGPAVRLYSDGGVGVEYYFLKNNTLSVDVFAAPYRFTKNLDGVSNQSGHNGSFGASVNYYFRLWPKECRNRFFFNLGMGWTETFGEIILVNRLRSIQYSWNLFPKTGFQFRMNDHFYFGIDAAAISYTSTKLRRNENRVTFFSVYNGASVYMTMKF